MGAVYILLVSLLQKFLCLITLQVQNILNLRCRNDGIWEDNCGEDIVTSAFLRVFWQVSVLIAPPFFFQNEKYSIEFEGNWSIEHLNNRLIYHLTLRRRNKCIVSVG